jgi:cytochrome c oxidase subunit I+III
MMRLQLAVPRQRPRLRRHSSIRLYTLHGTVMMFLFAVPIFEAVAILMLPSDAGRRGSCPSLDCPPSASGAF